jgi:hypothetical protein
MKNISILRSLVPQRRLDVALAEWFLEKPRAERDYMAFIFEYFKLCDLEESEFNTPESVPFVIQTFDELEDGLRTIFRHLSHTQPTDHKTYLEKLSEIKSYIQKIKPIRNVFLNRQIYFEITSQHAIAAHSVAA